jgi:acyl-coenzyme A synthetase/AMP-(fatty) acid ligase
MSDLALIRHEPHAAFAYRSGTLVRAGEFLAEVADLAAQLPDRYYAINLCTDRYLFAVALAAALVRGQVTLLPPNQTPDLFQRLARDYPETYCLSDGPRPERHMETVDCAARRGRRAPLGSILLVPATRIAAIVFTSGSTGDPVPHPKTWGRLVASALAEADRLALDRFPGLALIGTVPAQHMYGLESTVLLALQAGLILHSGRPFFPADVCAGLEALERPRGLVTTPVHLRAILAAGQVPPVDFLLCATAPLAPQLAAEAERRFGCPLYEIYGCTEAGQLATRRTVETPQWWLFPRFAMRQNAKGTWVSEAHIPEKLLLNDVIELVSTERFLLHGRTADLVNIAGKRTSLASLNYHLNSIPGVLDAAFFVPQDAGDGVTRLAALVVAPALTVEAVLAALRQRIDPAFLPRPVCMVSTLPRNETGKLPRAEVEALVARAG